MKKNFLFGVITFFLSLLILMSIYSILIIPYKIYTNSARVTSSQNNNRFDENYGYTLNKNLNSLINLNYINKSYKVISDKNGARISEKNLRDNNDNHKILIVGDSLSFGYGLNYEDTFGYLLEKGDQSFDSKKSVFWVSNRLSFGGITNFNFTALYKCDYRWCCSFALSIRDNNRFFTFHD